MVLYSIVPSNNPIVLSVTTIGNLSYGAWQSWWLAAIWLVACFMCVAIEPIGRETDLVR